MMFNRFTQRSQKVLQLAQEEAIRLKHESIGTEHILLGLIREGSGIAAKALEAIEVAHALDKPFILMQHVPFSTENLIVRAK